MFVATILVGSKFRIVLANSIGKKLYNALNPTSIKYNSSILHGTH